MNETTKRRALWAASKVTFTTMAFGLAAGTALYAVGCADDETAVPLGERDGTEGGTTKGDPHVPGDRAATTATTSAPPKTTPPSPAQAACSDVTCCNAKVGPLLSEEDAFQWEEEKIAAIQAKLGPDGMACCTLLLQHTEDFPDDERSADHWACCSAAAHTLAPTHAIACTPWGPPTPPSFDDETFSVIAQVIA